MIEPDEEWSEEEWSEQLKEHYGEWLEEKAKIASEDSVMYEPRDREQFIEKHELNAEK